MATVVDEKRTGDEKFPVEDEKYPVDTVDNGTELRPDDDYVLDYADDTSTQFTWRAAIVGSLLGCVVAASNLYVGLKVGWTFGASLWGAIFGFIILKPFSRLVGSTVFGPKENATCQAAATAAGGLSAGYVTAVPALYRLGLMPVGHIPKDDAVTLVLWTLSAAFFGMFFAVPLRSHFVINQDLPFPTPRAAAETIKALHRGGEAAAADAKKTGYFLFGSFGASFLITVGAYWVHVLESIHFVYYIAKAAGYQAMMNADAKWGWYFSWDFAFFGAGLMTPGSTVWSFVLGELIAFGIAGPLMVDSGYLTAKTGFLPNNQHTAQSWFLWPGIALMLFTAFGELAVHGRSLWHGILGAITLIKGGIRRIARRGPAAEVETNYVSKDPVPDHLQVPMLWWMGGFVVSLIFTVCVMSIGFKTPVWATIVAILLSFILAMVALQASGETDINPTGPVSKVTQLVFSKVPGESLPVIQKTNLMCANITASICSQSVDMVGDLKTGHLLAASPRSQFFAQIIGSVFAVVVAIPLFILYTSAYKCIIIESTNKDEKCPFELTAVLAWQKVCQLLTGGGNPVPKESLILTIVCIFLALIAILIRVKFIPEKWRPYWINMNAIGIGFINSSPTIPIAMAIGWTIGVIWKRVSASTHEKFMYAIAAGLISGVGVAGIIKAFLTLSDVPATTVTWGCPWCK
ncbi:hypothetical protein BGZ73_005652 [Actinomortierella ambigua]|nr:hypothetical protein BGZ73_005652 [Actinomortierella ambigua]